MSDLESVDLSKDSDSETVQDSPSKEGPRAEPPAPPKKSSMPSTPQRTPQRNAAARVATANTQNGTVSPRRRLKERTGLAAPASKVVDATTAPSKTAPAKDPEKTPPGKSDAMQNAPPPKPKRGRPKKPKPQPRSEVTAIAQPQAATKPAAAIAKTPTTATPSSPATQTTTPKAAGKSGDGEAPRPSGRGRKRQLLTKPVGTNNEEKTQKKTDAAGSAGSQQPPATQNAASTQKRTARMAERKLHGAAAKAAALKRRREEEEQTVTYVPKTAPSRGSKKGEEGASPEVSEVPPSPVKRGRPPKRLKQQTTRQVPREVIRIEDDDTSPEPTIAAPLNGSAENEKQDTGATTGQNKEKAKTVAVAPAKGRQSLPASYGHTASRRNETRDLTSTAGANRRLDAPPQDEADEESERTPQDQSAVTRKQKENATAPSRLRKPRGTRHSTGNLTPMDVDESEQPEHNAKDETDAVPNKKALESMLDEIQRNAIPFLLKQDKICDSFSARMEKDVDGILNNTASDVFQVFSDQVKDALVSDRLRLAVASGKTELRRGIEKLLREFARKVGAPLMDEDSSLLLRNEAFRSSRRVKEERRLSKPFAITSPRISKLTSSRRVMEENHDPNKATYGDFISDDHDRHPTTPRSRNATLHDDIPLLSNAADLKKFVQNSYENLDLNCYRTLTVLKLCARPGGMTVAGLHEVTPLGLQMIRHKIRDLIDRGYLVEDIIRENGVITTVYSTAAHISAS